MSARSRTRTLTVAAVLALASLPVRLGEAVATDAAVYLGQVKPPKASKTSDSQILSKVLDPRAYVSQRATRSGIVGVQQRCLMEIIRRESRFNPKADNPRSSAYGLFQQLHLKPGTPIEDQVRLGLKYLRTRYPHGACQALRFHTANGYW